MALSRRGQPSTLAEGSVLPRHPKRLWAAGTLTYSSTGLLFLFLWLLGGDFAFTLKERAVPPTLVLLLNRFQASNTLIGLLTGSLPQLLTLLLLPVLSLRSDRLRSRFGRRIPFLFAATPLTLLAMLGLGFSPPAGNLLHQLFPSLSANHAILLLLALFWMLFEACSILIDKAIFAGLCNDVVPPPLLGRFYGLFRVIGLAAAMTYTYFLLGRAEKHYRAIFIVVGLIYFFAFGAMCLKVREGQYPPPDPAPRSPLQTLRIYLRESFSHRYYLWFFLYVTLTQMAAQCLNLFYIPFAKSLRMDLFLLGKFQTLQLFLSLLQAYPLGWLSDRFHPLRVSLVATALYSLISLFFFFFVHDARTFGISIVVAGMAAGWWNTLFYPLAPAILPRPKFAQFMSAMSAFSSVGLLVGSYACGGLLDLLHSQYRYVFLFGALLNAGAVLAGVRLFMIHSRTPPAST